MKITLTGGPVDGRIIDLKYGPANTINVPVLAADGDLVTYHYSGATGAFIGEAGRQNWAALSAEVMRDTMKWIWRDLEQST